jgi:hypothetical protein
MISVEGLWLEEKKSKISVFRCWLLVVRKKHFKKYSKPKTNNNKPTTKMRSIL